MPKEFDHSLHMDCPRCGFEVVYVNPEKQTIALVFRDGKVDPESESFDLDAKKDETHSLMCNRSGCSWRKDVPRS
jgi:hypothetical protein